MESHNKVPITGVISCSIIIVVVLLACLCVISACVGITALMGTGGSQVITEQPKVESVIDEYLRAMEGQDAREAYALLSTRAKRYVSLADIEKSLEGNNYKLFEGYQSIAVTNFAVNLTADSNPDNPQGLIAEVDGMISYAGGSTGNFYAVLEQEGDEWRLFYINLYAPADNSTFNIQ